MRPSCERRTSGSGNSVRRCTTGRSHLLVVQRNGGSKGKIAPSLMSRSRFKKRNFTLPLYGSLFTLHSWASNACSHFRLQALLQDHFRAKPMESAHRWSPVEYRWITLAGHWLCFMFFTATVFMVLLLRIINAEAIQKMKRGVIIASGLNWSFCLLPRKRLLFGVLWLRIKCCAKRIRDMCLPKGKHVTKGALVIFPGTLARCRQSKLRSSREPLIRWSCRL